VRAVAALPLLWLCCACPEDPVDPPKECFLGDPSADPEVTILLRQADGSMIAATEGSAAPLIKPPQLGKVIFVGARARNLDMCGLKVTASLRDECTHRLLSLEGRPVTLTPDGEGWAIPGNPLDIANFSNLPGCPAAAATRDVEGEPYLLRLKVEDRKGREAEAKLHVVPTCAEPENEGECKCECDGHYVLGEPCTAEPDGGLPPGTCTPDAAL
jgi:hypothetical protein